MNIVYRNFWEGFDPNNNFLTRLLELSSTFSIPIPNIQDDEIVLLSHFPPRVSNIKTLALAFKHFLVQSLNLNRKFNDIHSVPNQIKPSVFYTGENYRVPNWAHYSMSHDLDDFNSSNIYYPYLFDHLLMAKLDQQDHLYGAPINYESLLKARKLESGHTNFACIFYGNGTPLRARLVDEMSKYGKVDVFGKATGIYIQNRSDLYKKYKYVLCPENDYFPGYVTEKMLHAYAMGSVPIYWGGLTAHQGVNHDSLLMVSPEQKLESRIAEIANIGDLEYKRIYEKALLLHEPNWREIIAQILQWIASGEFGKPNVN